jgi:hypothetical protein
MLLRLPKSRQIYLPRREFEQVSSDIVAKELVLRLLVELSSMVTSA